MKYDTKIRNNDSFKYFHQSYFYNAMKTTKEIKSNNIVEVEIWHNSILCLFVVTLQRKRN